MRDYDKFKNIDYVNSTFDIKNICINTVKSYLYKELKLNVNKIYAF